MKLFAAFLIVATFAVAVARAQETISPAQIVLAENHGRLTLDMTNRLVDFFEWSLDEKLTDAERAELETKLVTGWQTDDCAAIEGVLYTLRFVEELKHLDEDARRETRAGLRRRFLDDFERRQTRDFDALVRTSFRQRHGRVDGLTSLLKR